MKLKILFLASAVAVLSLSAVAPQPPQSHPLSEIVPVDTDLNMSNYNIENVSSISLNNGIGDPGFLIDGFTITHPGEGQKLVLDEENDEWDIKNSDINLNGNKIVDSTGKISIGQRSVNISNTDEATQNLSVAGRIYSNDIIMGGQSTGDINPTLYFSPEGEVNASLGYASLFQGDRIWFRNSKNNDRLLNIHLNGTLGVPSGNLNLRGNNIDRVRQIDAGPSADDFEAVYRVFRNGDAVGAIDNSGGDVRLKAYGGSAELLNNQNDGIMVNDGGPVEVRRVSLNLNSNDVSNVNSLNPGASDLSVGGYLDVNAPVNTGNALDVGGTLGVDGGIESYSGIDMNGNNISSSDGEMCVGEYC